MMRFYYAARSGSGDFVRGSVESTDASSALAALRARKLFVSALHEAGTAPGMLQALFASRPLPARELAHFFRALATLTRAGVPMARALPLSVDGSSNKRLLRAVEALRASVQGGLAMSDAMQRQSSDFSALAIAAVKAGEQGAVIDDILDRLALALEREVTMRRKLVTALIYPAVVTITLVAVIALVLTTTIPTFAGMYQQLRVPMPRLLRALIFAGALLRSPAAIFEFLPAGLLVGLLVVSWSQSAPGMDAIQSFQLTLPIAGGLARKAAIARIARLLGMLMACGVSTHSAIPIVAGAVQNVPFRRSLDHAQGALAEGSSIAEALGAAPLYYPLFVQLVRVGEETGKITDTLERAAAHYEFEVESTLAQLGTLLEPMMILALGGLVGGVAASIFIPLYSLIGSMR